MMIRHAILSLLMPGLLFAQTGNHKNNLPKKKPHTKSSEKTISPVVATVSPAPYPLVSQDSLSRPGNYQEAVKQASDRQTGILLLLPVYTDSAGTHYNKEIPDSISAADYANAIFSQSVYEPGNQFVFYLPTRTEIAALGFDHELLYPAYLFLDSKGKLLGKTEGLKLEAYEASMQMENLVAAKAIQRILDLQGKYKTAGIDSSEMLNLIFLTKTYNMRHEGSQLKPDEFDLLDVFLKNYTDSSSVNPVISKQIAAVYDRGGYYQTVKTKTTIDALLRNYEWDHDSALLQYKLITNCLNDLYSENYGASPNTVAVSQATGNNQLSAHISFPQDQILSWHKAFTRRLQNVQQLEQSMKLLEKYYDILHNKTVVDTDFVRNQLLPVNNWYFDSVLNLHLGLPAVEANFQTLHQKLKENEEKEVDMEYGEFENFKDSYLKDLGVLLNNMSWDIFKNDFRNEWLPKLLYWSKWSLEIEPNNPYYLDTYAQLLYVSGKKQQGVENEQLAIQNLKVQNEYDELKGLLNSMQKVLASMKAGKTLDRKDYQP